MRLVQLFSSATQLPTLSPEVAVLGLMLVGIGVMIGLAIMSFRGKPNKVRQSLGSRKGRA